MKRKAFTLIELLVVIAIIAILAAILFPVFAKAREKARQSSCSSNLKQISMANKQYAQEYDEFLVPHETGGYQRVWVDHLQPFIKGNGVFVCPSDGTVRATNTSLRYSYGYNWAYLGSFSTHLAAVQSPSRTLEFGDSHSHPWLYDPTMTWACTDGCISLRHSDPNNPRSSRAVMSYVDGHVSFTKWVEAYQAQPSGLFWPAN